MRISAFSISVEDSVECVSVLLDLATPSEPLIYAHLLPKTPLVSLDGTSSRRET